MASHCIGPAFDEDGKVIEGACDRAPRVNDMCLSHYRQALRARERGESVLLTPLRGYAGTPLRSRQIRMSAGCVKVLAAEARTRPKATVSSVGREVLEKYARVRELVAKGERDTAALEATAFLDDWLAPPAPTRRRRVAR